MTTVSEAAVLLELADTGLLEVTADLRLVVRVYSSNVVSAWIVFRDGLMNHTNHDQRCQIKLGL